MFESFIPQSYLPEFAVFNIKMTEIFDRAFEFWLQSTKQENNTQDNTNMKGLQETWNKIHNVLYFHM